MASGQNNIEVKHQVWLQKLSNQKSIILEHITRIEGYSDHSESPYGEYAEELQGVLHHKLQKVDRVVKLIEQGNKLVNEISKPSELEVTYALIDNLMNELETNFEALEKWFTKIDNE